jgi:hypothetical protein
VVGVGKDCDVVRRQEVATLQRICCRVVDFNEPSRRVMFEPLADIAL